MSYYSSQEWKILRDYVVDRDDYTCQECGYHKHNEENRKLNVHHIIPRKQGGPDHPENLVTLCKHCHGKLEGQKRNPRNINDVMFEDVIDWVVEDSLKKIVNEELKVDSSKLYQKIVCENGSVCSNCHEFKYTINSEDIFVNIDERRITKAIEILNSKNNLLDVDSLTPTKEQSSLCFSCQQTDKNWDNKEHISKDELFRLSHSLCEFLEKSLLDIDKDLFYGTIRELKSKPSMQRKNREILQKAVEKSVIF